MSNKRNGNVVELIDGIICYTQVGDQTKEQSIRTVQTLLFLTEGLSDIKLLVDYSQSGKIGQDTIQSCLYAMKTIDFDKVAIFGASEEIVKLINNLAREAGISDAIHFVKSRDEGFEYLRT